MHAADVMTPDVIFASPETPLPELVRLMLDYRISALPVVDAGHIVGIISEGDLLRRVETGTEPSPSRWLELVTSTDR
ncbi:MAG: CBS domain-containing protein, partial [Acetobacteraceae bacterium]